MSDTQTQLNNLIGTLGSFWSDIFAQQTTLQGYVGAELDQNEQTLLDVYGAIAALSRFDIDVFRKERWRKLVINVEDLIVYSTDTYKFQETDAEVSFNGINSFDQTKATGSYRIPVAKNIETIARITDRPVDPTVEWVEGVDFVFDRTNSEIVTTKNPVDYGFSVINVSEGSQDAQYVKVWLYDLQVDLQDVYTNFGYVVGLYASSSSQSYKDVVNAVFDVLIKGSNTLSLRIALCALFDVPVVRSDKETVTSIAYTTNNTIVYTDVDTYLFNKNETPIVEVGDVVYAGDSLVGSIQFFEGSTLNDAPIPALSLSARWFASAVKSGLSFPNLELATTYTEHDDGFVEVRFPVNGTADDVEAFWSTILVNSRASGYSVANTLRTNPGDGQPLENQVQSTVNPMQYILDNLLKNNLMIVDVNIPNSQLIGNASKLIILRKILPAHVAAIVNMTIDQDSDVFSTSSNVYSTEESLEVGEPGIDTFSMNRISDMIVQTLQVE